MAFMPWYTPDLESKAKNAFGLKCPKCSRASGTSLHAIRDCYWAVDIWKHLVFFFFFVAQSIWFKSRHGCGSLI